MRVLFFVLVRRLLLVLELELIAVEFEELELIAVELTLLLFFVIEAEETLLSFFIPPLLEELPFSTFTERLEESKTIE